MSGDNRNEGKIQGTRKQKKVTILENNKDAAIILRLNSINNKTNKDVACKILSLPIENINNASTGNKRK